jgi:hypothetical protein
VAAGGRGHGDRHDRGVANIEAVRSSVQITGADGAASAVTVQLACGVSKVGRDIVTSPSFRDKLILSVFQQVGGVPGAVPPMT